MNVAPHIVVEELDMAYGTYVIQEDLNFTVRAVAERALC
jgi:hypothetical protein